MDKKKETVNKHLTAFTTELNVSGRDEKKKMFSSDLDWNPQHNTLCCYKEAGNAMQYGAILIIHLVN